MGKNKMGDRRLRLAMTMKMMMMTMMMVMMKMRMMTMMTMMMNDDEVSRTTPSPRSDITRHPAGRGILRSVLPRGQYDQDFDDEDDDADGDADDDGDDVYY